MSPLFLVLISSLLVTAYKGKNEYDPLIHSRKPAEFSLIELTQHLADDLFHLELRNLSSLDLMLPDGGFYNITGARVLNKKNVVNVNAYRHMLGKRQVGQIQSPFIAQSPLFVRARAPQAVQSSEAARQIDQIASIALRVSNQILTKDELNKRFDFDPLNLLANVKAPREFCPFKTSLNCNPNDKFSRIDGSCNNLQQPWLGRAETPYKRYFQPSYDDQINMPRTRSASGRQLPNPRVVSRTMSNDNFQFDNTATHLVAAFGQFISHDVTSSAVASDSSGRIVNCPCNANSDSCLSISMPSNENIMRMSCMQFTRSAAAFANFDCRLGHREQLNLLTHYLDATTVYGPNEARTNQLRSFSGGKLRTSEGISTLSTLPQGEDGSCRDTNDRVKCFAAGEGRVNENEALTGMHTLFLREHNRIANELGRVNPGWSDERLFQESRKVLIAEYQHVIYNEWLPVVIGFNTAGMFDLVPLSGGNFFTGYSSNVNPSLSGEFATAAMRFGHTLVRGQLNRVNGQQQTVSQATNLFDIIFRPNEIYNTQAGGIESLIMGLTVDPSSKFDTSVTDTLQNHLFEVRLGDGTVFAIDLVAQNINRGRDHGIPDYNTVREKCGLRRANSFQDLRDAISDDKIQRLASIYESVNDIDLYIGGLSEDPVQGGLIGSTFACILANQFKDMKRGDRFYYENGPSPTSFTQEQLAEIKKASMAKLLCDNLQVSQIQPNAFVQPKSSLNNAPRSGCSWLPQMDFSKWRE